LLIGLLFTLPIPAALALDGTTTLTISTAYPSMIVGVGETVSLNMDLLSPSSETVSLNVANLPKDWTAEFRGGGRIIQSAYVVAAVDSKVELRVTSPANVAAGTYDFKVIAKDATQTSEFPVEFIVKEKAPSKLSFTTDYPTLRGGSDTKFSYTLSLKNDGDDDLTFSLSSNAPKDFAVTFTSAGKDITDLPTDIKAGASLSISVSAQPLTSLAVGTYPIKVTAQSDTVTAETDLTAEVVGQPNLTITTSDGRLSGTAFLNKDNPIKLVLRNTGNSPAAGVKLTATAPTGWTVTLNPDSVEEVPANNEVEVTANIKPADNAIAGDYVLTFKAQPNQSASQSADFRVTVQTSTLWGAIGIILIAVAVAIVGMAVTRFGRR